MCSSNKYSMHNSLRCIYICTYISNINVAHASVHRRYRSLHCHLLYLAGHSLAHVQSAGFLLACGVNHTTKVNACESMYLHGRSSSADTVVNLPALLMISLSCTFTNRLHFVSCTNRYTKPRTVATCSCAFSSSHITPEAVDAFSDLR